MNPFLFVTANEHEKAAFEKYYKCDTKESIKGKRYFLGQFGIYKAAYIHINEQGTTNPAATMLVGELVRLLKPVAVVMVGIAFGANRKVQKIGDVLVSKLILPYDSQKFLKDRIHYKEAPKEVGFQLLNAFSDTDDWKYQVSDEQTSTVFLGSILTGSKLIDNYTYRSQLLKDFEEYKPIGGEMEAAGIYSVCRLHGVSEWIIIKSICDWGYRKNTPRTNKEHDQAIAANAAASFCNHIFSMDVFQYLIEETTKNVQSLTNVSNTINIERMVGNINLR